MNNNFRHVFHGKSETGKTAFAKEIARRYKKIKWCDGRNESAWVRDAYQWDCDLMVIDDVQVADLDFLAQIFYKDERFVDKADGARVLNPRPNAILIIDGEVDEREYPASFLRRFHLYRFLKTEVGHEQN
jgi:tRNA uridine 5-carbamoylmethylation protein Kti12